jgi:hypothetical protein
MRTLILLSLILLIVIGCKNKQPPMFQPQLQTPMLPPPSPAKIQGTYQGTWVTTNMPLNGTMQCDVTDEGKGNWKGKFYGVWRGKSFEYTVQFNGEPSKLSGKAVIDRAKYDWTGQISENQFKGSYTGNRYTGSFDLKK